MRPRREPVAWTGGEGFPPLTPILLPEPRSLALIDRGAKRIPDLPSRSLLRGNINFANQLAYVLNTSDDLIHRRSDRVAALSNLLNYVGKATVHP
jgi:hypothetical protein